MINDYFEEKIEYGEDGNFVIKGSYDICKELIDEIKSKKENLFKHFCRDVCEKMVLHYSENGVDVFHFHKLFNEEFDEVIKDWEIKQ